MEINDKLVRVFITSLGSVMIGEFVDYGFDYYDDGSIRLKYPYELIFNQETGVLKIKAIFLKEEWCKIDRSGTVEIPVNQKIIEMFKDQVLSDWSD